MAITAVQDLWRRFLEGAEAVIGPVLSEAIDDSVGIVDCTAMGVEYPFLVELHAFGADAYVAQGDDTLTDVQTPAHTIQAGERKILTVASAATAFFAVKARGAAAEGSELIVTAFKAAA